MSNTTGRLVQMLNNQRQRCQEGAELAELRQEYGMAIYYRTLDCDAALMLATVLGDDPRAAIAVSERIGLEQAIKRMDQEVLEARLMKAQAAA